MTPNLKNLPEELSHWPEQLRHAAISGHCDAFAWALALHVGADVSSPCFVVASRTRLDENGDIMETNPLSHVALEWNGSLWDVGGPDADIRWEQDWIPDKWGTDEFEWTALTPKELHILRQTKDQRPTDPLWIERFQGVLTHPPSKPEPPLNSDQAPTRSRCSGP